MSSKSVDSRVSLSTLRIAKSTRRCCPIEARRYERISFNLLKERSQLAIDTAIVSKIYIIATMFVNIPYFFKFLKFKIVLLNRLNYSQYFQNATSKLIG